MTSLHPGGKCEPCEVGRHKKCVGWNRGFCGCADGPCEIRLITGLIWDLDEPPNGHQQGEP